jgi:hypothetical protein
MHAIGARFGEPVRYPKSHGDLWTATWADDGAVYAAADDARGFEDSCNSNLSIHRMVGEMPPSLQAETVNPMSEYGTIGERLAIDNGMWKACGLACVEGVLYLSVSRHTYPWDAFAIQRAWDASIVKSVDHGKTWSRMPDLGRAMFPGYTFSTPFFVQYGQDGKAPDTHDAREYVYAVSNDGTWNNGNSMSLGRVRRDRLARLDPTDWEFVRGFDKEGRPVWRSRHDMAGFTFRAPARASMTGVHYIEGLGEYLMPQWHNDRLEDKNERWKSTRIELYRAPAPWGPWELIHSEATFPKGFYNPCVPSKYISSDGRKLWIFASGDWTTAKTLDGMYGLFMIPVELEVGS